MTESLLNKIVVPTQLLQCRNSMCHLVHTASNVQRIDKFYFSIICALQTASALTALKVKHNFFKFWCDEELNLIKEEAIASHNVWRNAGRPRSGVLFNTRKR